MLVVIVFVLPILVVVVLFSFLTHNSSITLEKVRFLNPSYFPAADVFNDFDFEFSLAPLPPTPSDSDCPSSTVSSSTLSEMASVRGELLAYFTHVLLGDALAAEYLILHLISDVYAT